MTANLQIQATCESEIKYDLLKVLNVTRSQKFEI